MSLHSGFIRMREKGVHQARHTSYSAQSAKKRTYAAMLPTTAISLFFLIWSSLFLIDYYLRNANFSAYIDFADRTGLTISPFQLRFYISRFDANRSFPAFASVHAWRKSRTWLRFFDAWFSIGAFVGLVCFVLTTIYLSWLLVYEVLNWTFLLNLAGYNLFSSFYTIKVKDDGNYEVNHPSVSPEALSYVPYQQHVQSGITPVIPGVNIPWSHLPLFMFVLIVAGVIHELGHALAAVHASVRLNGFGLFLFAVYPGAFTEIETDELNRSSPAQKLRIFSAGIWHNLVLAFIGLLIFWMTPWILMPFYTSDAGVLITDVRSDSGLAGPQGLRPGHIVTQINQCQVKNISDWVKCLESLRSVNQHDGYLLQYEDFVLPSTATISKVTNVGGEMQCCAEFPNITLSSHICFQYRNPAYKEPQMETTTKAVKFAESLGIKNRVKRANVKPKATSTAAPSLFGNFQTNTSLKSSSDPSKDAPPIEQSDSIHTATVPSISYACLPARQVTDHTFCDPAIVYGRKETLIEIQNGNVCVVPALFNGTTLLRFDLQNRTRPVLFIGLLEEPLYLVEIANLTPRFSWAPYWAPSMVELFAKYIITFSLALGLLNAVPCYGLDGQFMCRTVVDYFFNRSVSQKQRISGILVMYGTVVFSMNMFIGFTKFLLAYWK